MEWPGLRVSIVGSLIAALIITVCAVGWRRLRLGCLAAYRGLRLARRIGSAGLTNFYTCRDDFARYRGAPRLIDYLRLARKSIDAAVYWMAHGNEMEGIAGELARLTQPPTSLRIVIAMISPKSKHLPALASYLDMDETELVQRIRYSLGRLSVARDLLRPEDRARFELRVYETLPIASVIILDREEPDGRVQIDLKPYKAPRQSSFAFEFTGKGHPLFDLCARTWGRLVDEASNYDASILLDT